VNENNAYGRVKSGQTGFNRGVTRFATRNDRYEFGHNPGSPKTDVTRLVEMRRRRHDDNLRHFEHSKNGLKGSLQKRYSVDLNERLGFSHGESSTTSGANHNHAYARRK